METAKEFMQSLIEKLKGFVDKGDVNAANEVTANIMVGTIMVIMGFFSLVVLALNEFEIFTVDKTAMRVAIMLSILIETPAVAVNKKHHGEKPWLKGLLLATLVVQCAVLMATLSHNVTLLMILPVLISIRYYEVNLTAQIAGFSTIAFTAATFYSGFFGIVNVNFLPVEVGNITTEETIRKTIEVLEANGGFARWDYVKNLLVGEYLPRIIIFSVVAIAACYIARRGREMIDLQKQVAEKTQRLSTELELATNIQTSMLPCIYPAFPEHENLDLYAFNIPAKEVGGDFYDYFKIDDDHVALVMADVSGKGIGAALFMTISKIVIKNCLLTGMKTGEALTIANNQICENNEAGLFVTVWAGIYESSTGKLTYTNAGHNPPILCRKNGNCEYLSNRHGLVLAGYSDVNYKQDELYLKAGDEIFLYTDGVTEATNAYDELYGEERLLDFIKSIQNISVDKQIRAVKEDIDKFVAGAEQFDDITMMGMSVSKTFS